MNILPSIDREDQSLNSNRGVLKNSQSPRNSKDLSTSRRKIERLAYIKHQKRLSAPVSPRT